MEILNSQSGVEAILTKQVFLVNLSFRIHGQTIFCFLYNL